MGLIGRCLGQVADPWLRSEGHPLRDGVPHVEHPSDDEERPRLAWRTWFHRCQGMICRVASLMPRLICRVPSSCQGMAFGLLVWLIAQPLLNSGAGAVPCACACAARFSPPPAPHPSTSNSSTCSTCSAPAAAPQGKPSGVQGGRGAPVHAKTWGAWCATNASYGKLPKPHENLGFNTIFPETQKVRHSLNGPTYCTHAHIRYEKVIVPFKVHLSGFAFS